jgi:phage-related protein
MWSIVFYKDRRSKCPPLEFIEELSVVEQAKIRNALRLLQEFGTNLSMPHARPIQGKLWELRAGGVRLFYFAYIGHQFVILHGYRKQSMKAPDREIAIALRRMEELLSEV